MVKNFKKLISLLIFLVILIGCAKSNLYFSKEDKIKISKDQIARFKKYLEGNYYSYSEQTNGQFWKPYYFAISEDGSVSGIVSCYKQDGTDCIETIEFYMLRLNVEKKTGKKIFVIARGPHLVTGKSSSYFINKQNFESLINKYFQVVDVKKNYFFDKVIYKPSGQEYDN